MQIGLLEMVCLKNGLTEALGRNIDIATERQLNPYMREEILDEMVTIFER
jgi:predicted nucleotidyltransferase